MKAAMRAAMPGKPRLLTPAQDFSPGSNSGSSPSACFCLWKTQALIRGFRVVVKLNVFICIKCLEVRLARGKW